MRDFSADDFAWDGDAGIPFDAASVVDRHSAFDGTFRSQKDLRVEGELKGTISCDGTLFVAEGATVTATVDAEHISVAGDLSGEIRCRGRLQILPSGRVRATVSTSTLIIQEGAVYEGQLDMAGVELNGPRPLRARAPITPVVGEVAAPDRPSVNGTTFIRRLGSPEAPWESPGPARAAGDEAEDPDAEGPADSI